MERSQFWTIIDQSRPHAGWLRRSKETPLSRPCAKPETLGKVLAKMPREEILAFHRIYRELLNELNQWSVWGAGYVINGGMSDDSFRYFRSWLIGKGQAVVDVALNAPDDLGPAIDTSEIEVEALEYVALDLLGSTEISEENFDGSPQGIPFDEDTVDQAYPKLAKRFSP